MLDIDFIEQCNFRVISSGNSVYGCEKDVILYMSSDQGAELVEQWAE